MDPSPRRGSPSRPHPTHNHDGGHSHSNSNASNVSDLNHHRVRFAEGEPQATYTVHHQAPSRRAARSAAAAAAQPPVYWDERDPDRDNDRDSDANLAGYTFYREGTPTPPDYEGPEKRNGHHGHGAGLGGPIGENSTIGGGTAASDREFNLGPHHHGDNGNWSIADSNDMSTTTRKRMLWVLIAVGIFILVGIGVGVGLGVGLSKGKGTSVKSVDVTSRFVMWSAVFLFRWRGI
jgi:hypothetical protein